MLNILVLICSVSLDRGSCDRANADNVIRLAKGTSAEQCAFMSQAMLASATSLIPDPAKQYVKVVCARERDANAGR